ncbi:MAG: hypothetical protein RBS78_08660 [Coriobacteriia bacterium]|jgi:hypothetical protein|nr:hypothetical protein [Coriobacteriia bacterium]
MKKTLFVFALAIVLVLSFSSIAFAKYAGYAYNNPVPPSTDPNPTPGYLSWTGANVISAQQNGGTSANGSTAHGGYAVNTTKCAVCHSVHRAASDLSAAGVGSYWKLTPGGQACVACHTPSGSNPVSTALVEWPSTYSDGGPHSSFSCLGSCHGSVHGAVASEYGAVAAWNLTSINDPAIAAAFAAGNVSDSTGPGAGGSNAQGIPGQGNATYALINDAAFRAFTTATPQDISTMRAMATGYTCGRSGCHSSSQFAVNKHGYGELRASDPRASATLDKVMTAHITNMPSGCGPCHVTNDSKCAACHDMVGQATNSSAFPHANRNISVQEKDAAGAASFRTVGSGNLWMYAGDATYRDGAGVPTAFDMGGVLNNSRTVIEDSAAWHTTPGNINDGTCLKCHGYEYWPTHAPNSIQSGTGHQIPQVQFSRF